jgi:hypothetical protein
MQQRKVQFFQKGSSINKNMTKNGYPGIGARAQPMMTTTAKYNLYAGYSGSTDPFSYDARPPTEVPQSVVAGCAGYGLI